MTSTSRPSFRPFVLLALLFGLLAVLALSRPAHAEMRLDMPAAVMRHVGALAIVDAVPTATDAATVQPAAKAPGVFERLVLPRLIDAALDPKVWGALAMCLWFVFKHYFAARAAKVQAAIEMAFHVVEDLKATGMLPDGVTKPVVALEQLHLLLGQQGVTATDAEVALARAAWSAMHGQQKAGGLVVEAVPVAAPAAGGAA